MDNVNQELHKVAQSEEDFTALAKSLVKHRLDAFPQDSEQDVLELRKISLIMNAIAEHNCQWMFYYCESPIERTLVATLIIRYLQCNAFSLIIAPNFLHHANPLQAFQDVCKTMKEFSEEDRFKGNRIEFLGHLRRCYDEGVVTREFFEYARNHFLFYNFLDLSDSIHLNLQPVIKRVALHGRTVRPDLLFWSPAKPQFRMIVECDGFKYHSSRSAFIKDRQRDRYLKSDGYDVLRFSGSEIYQDVVSVVNELVETLDKLI